LKVLEVDQWHSIPLKQMAVKIEDFESGKVTIDDISGGDADAVKLIFGGNLRVREVKEDWRPVKGDVWFINDGETSGLKVWKANYDTSG
jgi:hypothetical protein